MKNKNQLATMTGTGVALKNASKSLKITNKLLAEVDDFEKHWQWWLSLDDKWRILFLKKELKLDCVDYKWEWNKYSKQDEITINQLGIDWFDKELMKNYIENILALTQVEWINYVISDISALANLTKLSSINLSRNEISDISALVNLSYLTKICFWQNQIDDISILAKLPSLIELDLGRNEISNISILVNLTNLTYLNLCSNQISSVSELRCLSR